MKPNLNFKVRITGSHPKDGQIVVSCGKGELFFDYEMWQFTFPKNFKEHCRNAGVIWAILYEDEISLAIANYLSKAAQK